MQGLSVNGLDLAVGVVLLISALIAFMRGFVHEVLSIAAWIGAVAAVIYGFPFAQPKAREIIPITWAADAAAAVAIFLVVLLILSIATHAAARAIQKSALNNLDRTLGFVFGVARAMVILAVGLIITDWLTERERPAWLQSAKTLPVIEMAANGLIHILPPSFIPPAVVPDGGANRMRSAMDAASTLQRLNRPAPTGKDSGTPAGGYQNQERRDMERLLQGSENAEGPAQ